MGKNNSSEKRVKPLGEYLALHPEKIKDLLGLVCDDDEINSIDFSHAKFFFSGEVNNEKMKEKALQPPIDHLKRIIDLIYTDDSARKYFRKAFHKQKVKIKNDTTRTNREALAKLAKTQKDVEKAIDSNERWAILEGASRPDLFIEGDKTILVIEGKLTEPHTTTTNRYLETRDQMLRHIQGTIAYNKREKQEKNIIAFYIVPESFSQKDEIKDRQSLEKTIDRESVKICDCERKRITSCYYGFTTWERVNIAFPEILFPEIE